MSPAGWDLSEDAGGEGLGAVRCSAPLCSADQGLLQAVGECGQAGFAVGGFPEGAEDDGHRLDRAESLPPYVAHDQPDAVGRVQSRVEVASDQSVCPGSLVACCQVQAVDPGGRGREDCSLGSLSHSSRGGGLVSGTLHDSVDQDREDGCEGDGGQLRREVLGSGVLCHLSAHDVEQYGGQDADSTEERRYPPSEERGCDKGGRGEERGAGDLLRCDRLPEDPENHKERRKRAGQDAGPVSAAGVRVSVGDVPHRFVATNPLRTLSINRMTAT